MPMFDFKCEPCNLKFEEFVRGKKADPEAKCPACGELSPRHKVQGFSFQFKSGKVPGNSGVDSLDSSADLNIGRDADKRWEAVKRRAAYKRQVQHDNGGIGKVPLARNQETGEYVPVPKEDLPRIQKLHTEYQEVYEEHKARREAAGVGKFSEDDPISAQNPKKGSNQ